MKKMNGRLFLIILVLVFAVVAGSVTDCVGTRVIVRTNTVQAKTSAAKAEANTSKANTSKTSTSKAKTPTCKSLCSATLKATGGADKLKYKSTSAMDFGALSFSARSKVKDILYLCEDKEVYILCVMKAANASDAGVLYKQLKKYKKSNAKSDYLNDYSKTEQNVLKNAICGKKGLYVWYISMSDKKEVNQKGQKAIKKAV